MTSNHKSLLLNNPLTRRCGLWQKRLSLSTYLCFCVFSLSMYLVTDVTDAVAEEVVSGVLESVNVDYHTVQIRNALDQSIFLKITKPHLLANVTKGERVTVVVNAEHEIIKLIATPIPELPSGHIPGQ